MKKNMKRFIGMIAGGTGITPIWQILEFFTKKKNRIKLKLIFANIAIENIPLFKKLKNIEKKNLNLDILFLLEKPSEFLKHENGLVNKHFIKKHIGNPDIGKSIFVCGPPKMNVLIFEYLNNLGFSQESIIKF